MVKELQLVDLATDEVLTRVDVSMRDELEVRKTRASLEEKCNPGQEVREVG